jgi:DNA-binding HxlR family transcriptional regulator
MSEKKLQQKEPYQLNEEKAGGSPMTDAMQAIGGKWKLLLLDSIRRECPKRFGELRKEMQYITHTTLTSQLRELERDGILTRAVFPEVPPRVEYKLTELGKQLIPVMDALCQWGELYGKEKNGSDNE